MNPVRKVLAGGALALTAIAGGAIGASFLGTATAQTSSRSAPATSSSDSSTTAPAPDGHRGNGGGPHQANGITETPLTGDDLSKATTAAQAAGPTAPSIAPRPTPKARRTKST